MPTLLLTAEDVQRLLSMRDLLPAVEAAFVAYARGEADMPPKVYLEMPDVGGDFRAMPARVGALAGVKWVNSHPRNPERHKLPTVMGVYILSDSESAYPLAVMDGTSLTKFRTGAAAGVATKYLARPNASTIGLIGSGVQAVAEVLAIELVRDVSRILAYDANPAAIERLAAALPGRPIRAASIEAAAGADVVCTATPVTSPIVQRSWIQPGTHVNAIGADGPGKEELDPQILLDARVVVDDRHQAEHGGEINVPVSRGIYSVARLAGTLGEVAAGRVAGRVDASDITVFDSTGLAIQDVAAARVVYEAARAAGVGHEINLVG